MPAMVCPFSLVFGCCLALWLQIPSLFKPYNAVSPPSLPQKQQRSPASLPMPAWRAWLQLAWGVRTGVAQQCILP